MENKNKNVGITTLVVCGIIFIVGGVVLGVCDLSSSAQTILAFFIMLYLFWFVATLILGAAKSEWDTNTHVTIGFIISLIITITAFIGSAIGK